MMSKSAFIRQYHDVLTTLEMVEQIGCTRGHVVRVKRALNDANVAKRAEKMRRKVRRNGAERERRA